MRSTRDPVRRDPKFFCDLSRVVGFQLNFKEMLAAHSRVHHYVHVNRGGLTWLECRLTDDDFGWSTTLQHGCDARRFEFQRFVTDILGSKHCAHGTVENLIAEINSLAVNL